MTLASFVELYFNDREHHVRDTTMDTKRNIFDTKIVPLLGNRKMNEITALDIRDWQQRIKEMGEATGLPYSETYLYTIHAQLTTLFNYAQTFYGLRFNPCDASGYMGSSVAGEMLIITKDQYELLRKEFRNEAYLLAFDILFWTGCREGEMLALLPKDLTDDDQLVVSFWGSMGAKYMNEHMAGELAFECKNGVPYHHVHATGAAAREWLPRMAKEQGADFDAHPNIEVTEYIYDMADRMAAADLIVCRAGAATLGELCMLGRPALLVPSPYVAENHQEKNARALEKEGGCRVLLDRLHRMGHDATKLAAHDASEKIYQEILWAIENHGKK